METTLAVMERQQQFDFQKNGIEVMNFETLQRTYKENDIYNNPVQGIYHYQVIRRMMDICEKYNLDYEVEEIYLYIGLLTALRVSHDSSDRNLSSTVETYPLNQSQISIFTEEVLKLAMSKGQITAWDLYNVATEIYKPGKTDFPALIPQNGAMAELLLSRLSEEVEVQDAVPIN